MSSNEDYISSDSSNDSFSPLPYNCCRISLDNEENFSSSLLDIIIIIIQRWKLHTGKGAWDKLTYS